MTARCLWLAATLLVLAPAFTPAAEKDLYGDPLPEGAKARLGTARLRTQSYNTPQLSPDGKALFVSGSGGLLRIDPTTGATLGKVPLTLFGSPAGFSSDGKRGFHVTYDSAVVWEVDSGKTVAKVQRRLPSSENGAALSADGKTLAIGGVGERQKKTPVTVLVWDVGSDKEVKSITVPQNEYSSVAISGDGKLLASWGYHYDPDAKMPDPETNPNRFVHFWEATTGKELSKFRVAGYSPGWVAFSPDGSIAAVSGNNSTIDLVDPKTGTSKQLLLGRTRMGRGIVFSADGSVVAAVSDEGAVQRWKVADGSRLSTTEPPAPFLYGTRVRLMDNEKGVAWATKGSATVMWEVPSGKLLSPEGGHTSSIRGVAVTPDGKHAITSADDGATLKWELTTGKPAGAVTFRHPSTGFGSYQPGAIFSPDASKALVRDTGGGLGLHDMSNGVQQYVIPIPIEGGSNGTFSNDGSKVVVASSSYDFKKYPARVTVWDTATSKRVATIDLTGYSQVAAAVTPDGKHVVTAGTKMKDMTAGDFVITTWELPTGAKKGEHTEASGFVTPLVTAAPDSKSAAVVTSGGKLVSFDLATSKLGKTYTINRTPGIAPLFSPDGKRVAIATQTGFGAEQSSSILVIDWASGETKHTFNSPGQTPTSMAFAPDGKHLVTGSPDTTATVWDVSK